METLTRNNYEIWFLDYLDGQLSNEQLETLLDFLELNPDLKEELRSVSGIALKPGDESIDNKDILLKTGNDIPGIPAMDQLCIARMENDLSEVDAREFDQRLQHDKQLSGIYSAYRQTKLVPGVAVTFPNKNELRKKVVIFRPWLVTAISSAAVIVLVWFLWPRHNGIETPGLAKVETVVPETMINQPDGQGTPPETEPAGTVKKETGNPSRREPASLAKKIVPAETNAPLRNEAPMKRIARKGSLAGPRIPDPLSTRMMLASQYPVLPDNPLTADETLTLPQYALQLFRERVLGEEKSIVRKTRFTLWEVAGAGVNKFNSLAGTNMKLNRKYDSKGDLMAVSFNSRLIDVESPVKSQSAR